MEREEIERVEQELDAVLKLVQPEPPMQDKVPETEHRTHKKQAEEDSAKEQKRRSMERVCLFRGG